MVENLTGIFPMMQGCILDALNKSLGTQAAFTEKRGDTLRIDNRSSESRGAFENLCTWRFFMVNELGSAHRRSSRILVRTVKATDCVSLQYLIENLASVRTSSICACAAKAHMAVITVVFQFWAPRWLCHSIARSETDQRPFSSSSYDNMNTTTTTITSISTSSHQ